MPSLGSHRWHGFAIVVLAFACSGCASSSVPSSAAVAATTAAAPPTTTAPVSPRMADPTPVPNPSSSSDVIVTQDFEPPAPLCPGPLGQVDPPGVRVRIADGEPIAATMGSAGLQTCGTSGEYDVGDLTYPAPLVAHRRRHAHVRRGPGLADPVVRGVRPPEAGRRRQRDAGRSRRGWTVGGVDPRARTDRGHDRRHGHVGRPRRWQGHRADRAHGLGAARRRVTRGLRSPACQPKRARSLGRIWSA